jgi:hypothetical protein
MLEIVVCRLFISSLGLQAVVLGSWIRWQQRENAKQDEEEEEILTQYQSKENALVAQQQTNGSSKQQSRDPRLVGWEFKIVRAKRNLFRDPAVLQHLCEEEAEAGWIMLEKLDDRRVRFKRPIALREMIKSDFLNYDPYRCHYGSSWQPLNWLGAIIAVMAAMILPAYLGYALVSQKLASSSQTQILPAAFPPLDQPSNPRWGDKEVGVPSRDEGAMRR